MRNCQINQPSVLPCIVPTPSSLLTHKQDQSSTQQSKKAYLTHPIHLKIHPSIKCIVCIPQFHLSTHLARSVLPKTYTRPQVIFNLSRLTLLSHLLCQEELDAELIWHAMRDQIHQQQRGSLVPGLSKCLQLDPSQLPGTCSKIHTL